MQIWPHSRNNSIWTSEVPAPRTQAPQRIRPRLVLACTTPAAGRARLEETSKPHTLLLTDGRRGPSLRGIPSQSRYSDGRPRIQQSSLGREPISPIAPTLTQIVLPLITPFSHGTERHTRLGYHTRNRHNVRCRYCAVTYILTHLSSAFILQTASPFPILTKSETLTVLLVLRVSCASDSLAHVQVCCRIVNSCS